jgi:hypothetical protein
VFLEDDLAAYLGQLYAGCRQAPLSGSNREKSSWESTNAVMSGGYTSSHQTGREYAALLGLTTKHERKNSTTGSRFSCGRSSDSASNRIGVGKTPPSGG